MVKWAKNHGFEVCRIVDHISVTKSSNIMIAVGHWYQPLPTFLESSHRYTIVQSRLTKK